jgi:hypothetical protein
MSSEKTIELYNIFIKTMGPEDAQKVVKDLEDLIDSRRTNLATKEDIESLKVEIHKVEATLLKWFVGSMVALAGIFATLLLLK